MNDAGRIGFVLKGEYQDAATYDFLDVVYYDGASYVAKKLTVGNEPQESNEYWQIFAKNISDVDELEESVASIETWKDSTQQRLDNWGPTIVGHGQVINSNKDRIAALDSRMQAAEDSVKIRFQTQYVTAKYLGTDVPVEIEEAVNIQYSGIVKQLGDTKSCWYATNSTTVAVNIGGTIPSNQLQVFVNLPPDFIHVQDIRYSISVYSKVGTIQNFRWNNTCEADYNRIKYFLPNSYSLSGDMLIEVRQGWAIGGAK